MFFTNGNLNVRDIYDFSETIMGWSKYEIPFSRNRCEKLKSGLREHVLEKQFYISKPKPDVITESIGPATFTSGATRVMCK